MPTTATSTPTTCSSYLGRLHHEWTSELADHPATGLDGTPWSTQHPALTGPATLQEIVTAISAADREHTDAMLHALLSLAHDGHPDAARTVLQTMLPTVARHGRTARYRHLDDPLSCAGAAMWEAISAYPLHRTRSVAANLALEALHGLEPADASPIPVGEVICTRIESDQLAGHVPADEPTDQEAVAATIGWGLDHDVLSPTEARILALTHLAEPTPTSTQIAADLGLSAAAVRQRHSRAVRKLAAALTARLGGATSPTDLVALHRQSRESVRTMMR